MIKHSKLFLIFIPAILLVSFALFVQIIRYEPLIPKIDPQQKKNMTEVVIPILPTDPILGDKKAPITIIAFEDFSCPSCETQMELFKQLEEKHPERFKIIWKGLPVTDFPYPSRDAHIHAFCANRQGKFTAFKDFAFTNGQNLSPAILTQISQEIELNEQKLAECIASSDPETYITQIETLARILNIQSVPTFFIDNKQIKHPTTIDGWEALLKL